MTGLAPGTLLIYVATSLLLTIPASLLILLLHRRAVEHGIRAQSGTHDWTSLPELTIRSENRPAFFDADRSARLARRRLAVLYGLGALAAAIVWTGIYFYSPDLDFAPKRGFVVFYSLCWPIVPTLLLLFGKTGWKWLWASLAYIGFGTVVVIGWSSLSAAFGDGTSATVVSNARSFLLFLFMQASLPAAILATAASRRIRGLTALLFAGLLVFSFTTLITNELFLSLIEFTKLRPVLLAFGWTSRNLWFMLAAVPVGYLCWRVLRVLASRFQRKSFSDVQLLVDTVWLIVACILSAQFASDFGWYGIAGITGFAAYRGTVAAGLAAWPPPSDRGLGVLVLRVFGHRSRTEKLFDSVVQRLRFRGPVRLIGAPDLAARTIDPADTLEFLAGNLQSRFVHDAESLRERLETLDDNRDPDGRFRVTPFYCRDDVWSAAFEALLARSDLILMDLRSLSPANQGVIHEATTLAKYRRLDDALFVIDGETRKGAFEEALTVASDGASDLSSLHYVQIKVDTASERNRVYRSLTRLRRHAASDLKV